MCPRGQSPGVTIASMMAGSSVIQEQWPTSAVLGGSLISYGVTTLSSLVSVSLKP